MLKLSTFNVQLLVILFILFSTNMLGQEHHFIDCKHQETNKFIFDDGKKIKDVEEQYKMLKTNGLVKLPVVVQLIGYNNDNTLNEDYLARYFSIINSFFQKINASYYLVDIRFMNQFTDVNSALNGIYPFLDTTAYNLMIYHPSFSIGGSGGSAHNLTNIGENSLYATETNFSYIGLHEIGHTYGLPHTHAGTGNVEGNTFATAENVARSGPQANCDVAGDGFCDTPADPCCWSPDDTDIYGEPYQPDSTNIMSYYAFQSDFSPQQYEAMTVNFIEALNTTTRLQFIDGILDTIHYNLDAYVQTNIPDAPVLNSVESVALGNKIDWSPVAISMGYYVERSETSANSGFVPLTLSGVGPSKTEVIDRTADVNTTYWYRVICINSKDNYSNVVQFPMTPNSCDDTTSFFTACGVTVQVSGLDVSLYAVSEPDSIRIIKVRNEYWTFSPDLCNNWNPETLCMLGDKVTVPVVGQYFINIQGSPNCEFDIQIDGSFGDVDNDGDGLCASEDCDDNNSSLPAAQDMSCDDGDPNTTEDLILSGECECMGTASGCTIPIPNTCAANLVCASLIGNVLTVNTNGNPLYIISIHWSNFSFYKNLCAHWNGTPSCTSTITSPPLPNGDYLIRIQESTDPNDICWIPFSVENSDAELNDQVCTTNASELILPHEAILDGIYSASEKIISSSIIPVGSTVQFKANEEVLLLPEFVISAQATFEIVIDACL